MIPSSSPLRSAFLAPALIAAGTLALGSCSTAKLDTTRAQQELTVRLAAYYRPATVGATTCPTGFEARKGASFRCTTHVEGAPVDVVVTQADGKGRLTFAPAAAVLLVDATADDLRAKLRALYSRDGAAAAVAVDCGTAKVRVVPAGGHFDCAVTVNTQHFRETVTVHDVVGHVTYSSNRPGP